MRPERGAPNLSGNGGKFRRWRFVYLGPSYRLALGFGAGVVTGYLLGPRVVVIQPLADIFIASLKAAGPPVALFALLSSLASFSAGNLTRLGLRSLGWYLGTALVASTIGVLVAHALSVGVGFEVPLIEADGNGLRPVSGGRVSSFQSVLQGPPPHLIFWALFVTLLICGPRSVDHVAAKSRGRRLLDECVRTSYRILHWLMLYAPIGVFALIAVTFAKMKISSAEQLVLVLIAVYVAQAIICVSSLLVLWVSSHPPGAFVRGAGEALLTAFATGSSAATMPVEVAAAEQKLGVDRKLVGLILPLGLAIHKVGSAAALAGILVFAVNAVGQELTPVWFLWVGLLTCVASVVTPPISGGVWVALGLVAGIANLPMAAIAVAAGIPLLGKLNTPINSLGRLISVVVLAGQSRQAELRRREFGEVSGNG